MQTSYSLEMSEAVLGLHADASPRSIASYAAQESIGFGSGVILGDSENQVRLPIRNTATILFDADFVTGNTINLDVNGVSISEVAFDTNHATTMAALIAAVDALDGVSAVAGSGSRDLVVTDPDSDILIENIVVAGGGSQADATVTYGDDELFIGVSSHTNTIEGEDNVAQYAEYDAVNVMTRGRIWVHVEEAVAPGDPVYVRLYNDGAAKQKGQFRKSQDSVNAMLLSNASWFKGNTGAGLAVLEINNP